MNRFAAVMLAVLLAALLHPSVLAGNRSGVDEDGFVHTVLSEPWSQGNNSGGTVLVHVIQDPDGTESRTYVPGTDNFTLEKDPCIDLDPVTGTPVVVWAQVDGRATALYLARMENGAWNEPRLIWADGAVNLDPEIDIRENLVHLIWRQEGETAVRLRLSLSRESLEPQFGPEELPVDMPGISAPGADSEPATTPGDDLSFFASVAPHQIPDQPGRMITWGIRDEPVPVVYFQPFLLPQGIQAVKESHSVWIEDRFVTWFTAGSSFYYTTLHEGQWDDLRVIDLKNGRTTSEAILLLHDLIQR